MTNYIPTIGVLVISGNKVLLVKHTAKARHLTDSYGLPAGRLESDESIEEGALRELFEETSLRVNLNELKLKLTLLIKNKSLLRKISKNNLKKAKEFLWEDISKDLEKIYKGVLK